MFPWSHSLRFKLVAMFVMVFGTMQVVLGMVGIVARERYLRDQFDDELTLRAQGMVVQLLRSDEPFSEETLAKVIDDTSRAIHFREFYVQLRDARGQAIEQSNNLGIYRLPLHAPMAARRQAGVGMLETMTGPEVEKLAGQGERLRMVTLFVDAPGARRFYLQVATSLTHVRESIAFLQALFIVGTPVGLATAAIASWLVVGNAIHRINRVAEVAHQLTPDKLTRRLEPAQSQDEVGEMVGELNEMLDRLEAGFRAQEQFIHDASHELKTPVSVLLSEAQVLKLTAPGEADYQRFVGSVEEEMRRLGKLVESLLTLTRADGRNAVAQGQTASVNDAVVAAVQQCDPVARQRGVRLTLSLAMPPNGQSNSPPENEISRENSQKDAGETSGGTSGRISGRISGGGGGGEATYHGDPELIIAMLSNLIRNAVRFSPVGGSVEIEVGRQDRWAVIGVRDHGPGIPPGEIDKIFDRFTQGSNNAPRRGTGLGLTIAKSVAELHHGRLTAENAPEGGCRFTALLPLAG